MKALIAVVAYLSVTILADVAYAADPSTSLQPMLTIELRFGGAGRDCQGGTEVSTALEVQSKLPESTSTQQQFRLGSDPTYVSRLPIARMSSRCARAKEVFVLGRDMSSPASNSMQSTAASSSRSWLWWVAGGVATVGVVALAAGGSTNETNNNTSTHEGNCLGVGGSPPSVDTSGC